MTAIVHPLSRAVPNTYPDLDPAVSAAWEEAERLGALPADPLFSTLGETRAAAERYHGFLSGESRPPAEMTEHMVPGPTGPMLVRLYGNADCGWAREPALVYFHGGGFVVNSLNTHDWLLRMLAVRTGAVVCALGYDKAPERPFPHQYLQALALLGWLGRSADDLGIDAGRIALAGDSAGANLALATAVAALRDSTLPHITCLALFYGMFAADFDTGSHRQFGDGRFGLSSPRMRWFWNQYLPSPDVATDPRAAPLLTELDDLAGLGPVDLVGAGLDCLRDDTTRLAARLDQAGVPHTLIVHPRLPHSFLPMGRFVPAADAALSDAASALASRPRSGAGHESRTDVHSVWPPAVPGSGVRGPGPRRGPGAEPLVAEGMKNSWLLMN